MLSSGAIGSGRSPSAQRTRHPPNATRTVPRNTWPAAGPTAASSVPSASATTDIGGARRRSLAASDRGMRRPAAHNRYPRPATATSAATTPPIGARPTHRAAWRGATRPSYADDSRTSATFAVDCSVRSATNALPMASVAPRVSSAASTATSRRGNDSAAPERAQSRQGEAVCNRREAPREQPSAPSQSQGALEEYKSRKSGMGSYFALPHMPNGVHPDRSTRFPRTITDETRTYSDAVVSR